MKHTNLNEAIDRFSAAISDVIKTVPQEHIIDHLKKTHSEELQQMLEVCEQLEQYELCNFILKALQQKELIAA